MNFRAVPDLSQHAIPFSGVELKKTEGRGSFTGGLGFLAELWKSRHWLQREYRTRPLSLGQLFFQVAATEIFILGNREA